MKYLIMGDIHGKLPALEKMLQMEKGNFDKIICHGDVVNYGPWSNECVQLLNELENISLLKGNHEENFITGKYTGSNPIAQSFFQFCYPKFHYHEIIKEYGMEITLKNYKVRHTIEQEYIYPDSDLSLLDLKGNYFIGHSHYQFDRSFKGKRIVNTGSVGQNRKVINKSDYVLFDQTKDEVELKSFLFNINTVISKMQSEKYPEVCINYYRNKLSVQSL